MYLHARFNHLRANNGEFFLVDPDTVNDELKFIHSKIIPYVNLDADKVREFMDTLITWAKVCSMEDDLHLS